MAMFEKKKNASSPQLRNFNSLQSNRSTKTRGLTKKWPKPATATASSSKHVMSRYGGSFNGTQSDPSRGIKISTTSSTGVGYSSSSIGAMIKKKPPPKPAKTRGYGHKKSASVASISQKFGGGSKTFKVGGTTAKAQAPEKTQRTGISVKDRAAKFGGTSSKKSSQTKLKSSNAPTSPPSSSSIFSRSTFAKADKRSSRQGSGLRQGSAGARRLRGSSLTAARGVPSIVRNSVEKFQIASVKKVQVTARFSFDAEADDELSFRTGDVISISKEASQDWWEGSLGGKSGIFPKNYVTNI